MEEKKTKCNLCDRTFEKLGGLHLHLNKSHDFSQKKYYEKFSPKFDVLTGQQIAYKNYEDYASRLFASRKSEFDYLLSKNFDPLSKEILGNQLKSCGEKSKGRFPTYLEWRSSKNLRYDKLISGGLFDQFLGLARDNKLKFVFDYISPLPEICRDINPILTDTREQKPLFEGEKTTVNVGDYTLSKEFYNAIHVDRKSKDDFIGTFTGGLERFERECKKAVALGVSLVVLVESSFSECFSHKPMGFCKQRVTGENAFKGVRDISRKFDNIQFLFVEDRDEAIKYIHLVLNNKEILKKFDLQYIYEMGKFK